MNNLLILWKAFSRKKPIEKSESRLRKCIGTTELTALGIGSTLGVGIYVIIGTVAYKQAGPSVVLSFIIAATSSIFAGLCYAEFGALVPKAGSAYIYSYICVGELMAFIIGWNLILEYIIGAASVARSYSNYLDGLFHYKIKDFLSKYLKIPQFQWCSSYPDLFAFLLTMLLSVVLSFGVKESTQFNMIFTGVNFFVILYCTIVGSFKVNIQNWKIKPDDIPPGVQGGKGGFFPFGIRGTVSGAATCFYSFVGFDAIATTGEEVLDPQRSLPISIILSLSTVTFAYCIVSTIQTLMWPYWDQNNEAPLPYVFNQVGYPFAHKIITIGALAGLSTSLIGTMFPMPRIIYAMAEDCLLFKFLAKINPRFKTPVIATLLSGFLAALMATFLNVDQLAEMMSIGTLLAYTLVAISILILRYKKDKIFSAKDTNDLMTPNEHSNIISNTEYDLYQGSFWRRFLNLDSSNTPDSFSSTSSLILIAISSSLIFIFNVFIFIHEKEIYGFNLSLYATIILIVISLLLVTSIVFLSRQPQSITSTFQVPWVPYVPFFSVFANSYLMVHLNKLTWYRFIGWMFLGFIIYFSYGFVKSVGYLTQDEKNRLSLDRDQESHQEIPEN